MREEKWVLTNELHDSKDEPPVVAAFRVLQNDDWVHFWNETYDAPGVRFFNYEQREYSGADSWESLALQMGLPEYPDELAIPTNLNSKAEEFCRMLRTLAFDRTSSTDCDGCKAFHSPRDSTWSFDKPLAVLVVVHNGGILEPYFNRSFGDLDSFQVVEDLLAFFDMKRTQHTRDITFIYRT